MRNYSRDIAASEFSGHHSSFCIPHSNFLLWRKFPGLVFQHHRDVVLDRVGEAAGLADELGLGFLVQQRALAQRAHQYLEELAVHLKPVTSDE
jgi:hypothetical protein